jgi:hypothetical protein
LRGFIGGIAITAIFGLWQTGKNTKNILDYAETNARYFKGHPQEILNAMHKL